MSVDKATLYLIAAGLLAVLMFFYRKWNVQHVNTYDNNEEEDVVPGNIGRVRRALRRRGGREATPEFSDAESDGVSTSKRPGRLGKKKQLNREYKQGRRQQREHELAVWESKQKREMLVREYNATVDAEKEREAAKRREEQRRQSATETTVTPPQDTTFNTSMITEEEKQTLADITTYVLSTGVVSCAELQKLFNLQKQVDVTDRLEYLTSNRNLVGIFDSTGSWFVVFDENMLTVLANEINAEGRISATRLQETASAMAKQKAHYVLSK
eukprot:CFRG1007T1